MGDQLDAAQDKRPHEDIAEFAVRLQERAQPGTVELNDLAVLDHRKSGQLRPPGEDRHLSRELAGPVHGDEILAGRRTHVDLHGAR